jgi:hypothetical protein
MSKKNFLSSLPLEAKIIGGAAALGLGYWGLKKLFSRNYSKETTRQSQRDADQLQGNLTYSLTWYKQAADTLTAAMFDAGTNEESIYRIFSSLKNAKDFYQLVSTFGVRPYYTFGLKQGDYNLGQWFTEELSTSEVQKINNILASKKIDFRF